MRHRQGKRRRCSVMMRCRHSSLLLCCRCVASGIRCRWEGWCGWEVLAMAGAGWATVAISGSAAFFLRVERRFFRCTYACPCMRRPLPVLTRRLACVRLGASVTVAVSRGAVGWSAAASVHSTAAVRVCLAFPVRRRCVGAGSACHPRRTSPCARARGARTYCLQSPGCPTPRCAGGMCGQTLSPVPCGVQ